MLKTVYLGQNSLISAKASENSVFSLKRLYFWQKVLKTVVSAKIALFWRKLLKTVCFSQNVLILAKPGQNCLFWAKPAQNGVLFGQNGFMSAKATQN